jgi:hypothetical protein
MIHWLYVYIFRGIGIAMVIGMITILYLAVASQMNQVPQTPQEAVHGAQVHAAKARR